MWPNPTSVILTTKTMAQYSKNNYFDGVILPEPKEETLRRMAKGVDASKGYLTTNAAGVLFEGPRTLDASVGGYDLAAIGNPKIII